MITISIVGLGVVGKAMYEVLNEILDENEVKIKVFDVDETKNFQNLKLENLLDSLVIFLCLPTPNDCDISILEETCKKLSELNFENLCVIKSTVPPNTTNKLYEKYKLQLIHNPEFLSAKTAKEDFRKQKNIIIGTNINVHIKHALFLGNFYEQCFPESKVVMVDCKTSECMKLFCNNFYAVKIQFFTELYLLCEKIGVDFELIRCLMISNEWINPQHTQVPGTDGQISYGGMCFPKDTKALLKYMKENDTLCGIIESSVKERESLRND